MTRNTPPEASPRYAKIASLARAEPRRRTNDDRCAYSAGLLYNTLAQQCRITSEPSTRFFIPNCRIRASVSWRTKELRSAARDSKKRIEALQRSNGIHHIACHNLRRHTRNA